MHERRPLLPAGRAGPRRSPGPWLAIGATPNAISGASVGFAVGAGSFAWSSLAPPLRIAAFVGAGALIQGRLLCNLFDGMVAVEGKRSSVTGELWNDLPDWASDTAILVGGDRGRPAFARGGGAADWRCTSRTCGSSGGRWREDPLPGRMAKQHRMAALTAGCVVAAVGAPFVADGPVMVGTLAVIALGCVVTFVRRLQAVAADLHTGAAWMLARRSGL